MLRLTPLDILGSYVRNLISNMFFSRFIGKFCTYVFVPHVDMLLFLLKSCNAERPQEGAVSLILHQQDPFPEAMLISACTVLGFVTVIG